MALASQPFMQAGWSPLTQAANPGCREALGSSRVSSGTEAFAISRGGSRVGITCVTATPSTSGKDCEPNPQRQGFPRGSKVHQRAGAKLRVRAAVKEAAPILEVSKEAAAAALEAAYREPSFGLDDALALSDDLEVVGPPPDWSLDVGKGVGESGVLPLLNGVSGTAVIDTVRRGLDDVFEMSGDLDILGPSPDDTASSAEISREESLGRGLLWPQSTETVVSGKPSVQKLAVRKAERAAPRSGLDVATVESTDANGSKEADVPAESTSLDRIAAGTDSLVAGPSAVRRTLSLGGEGQHEQTPRKRKLRQLGSKAMDLVPVKTVKARVKRGDKKVVRRRWAGGESRSRIGSQETNADGLSDELALRAIYKEGVANIGSRTRQLKDVNHVNEWNLLTHEEEQKLGLVIQRSKALMSLKEELEASSGMPASDEEWAEVAGISVNALQRQMAAGVEAKQRLVECNQRLVIFVANSMKHYPNALPKEDMFLAGIQGLLVAAEKFDPSLGYRFTTFAVHAIRSHLRRAIQRMGALICPPVKRTNGQINLYKVRRELSSKLGRMPTLEEIAKHKNVSVEFVNDVVKWHRGMDVSFDNFSDGWDKYTASESGSELLALDEDYLKSDMELCLSTLPAKEGEILRRRYGLGGLPAMTLREIGKLMGMSYEMVRRYEARAMILMRKAQRVERLAAYRPMLGTSEGS